MSAAQAVETETAYVYKISYSHIKLTLMDKDDVMHVVSTALDQGHDVTVRRTPAISLTTTTGAAAMTTPDAPIGDETAKHVYLVEVGDRDDRTNRRYQIEVRAKSPSAAHKIAMRAGYVVPGVRGKKS